MSQPHPLPAAAVERLINELDRALTDLDHCPPGRDGADPIFRARVAAQCLAYPDRHGPDLVRILMQPPGHHDQERTEYLTLWADREISMRAHEKYQSFCAEAEAERRTTINNALGFGLFCGGVISGIGFLFYILLNQ